MHLGTHQALFAKASKLRDNGNFSEAIRLLQSNEVSIDAAPELLGLLIHCLILADQVDDASEYLLSGENLVSEIPILCWNKIRILLKKKEYDNALVLARRANSWFESNAEGLTLLGTCLRAKTKYEESLAFLNQAINLNPEYPDALINRAMIWLQKKEVNKASQDLAAAFSFRPHIKPIWQPLLNAKIALNEFKDALSFTEKMLCHDPQDYQVFYARGICNHRLGKLSEALNDLKQSLKIKPDFTKALQAISLVYEQQGAYVEALSVYLKILNINSDSNETYLSICNLLRNIRFCKANSDMENLILQVLDKNNLVRPDAICGAATSLLKENPFLKPYLSRSSEEILRYQCEDVMTDLIKVPLLMKLLTVCLIPDEEIESLLTILRAQCLLSNSNKKKCDIALKFTSALAIHCFINEYIYEVTDEETVALSQIEKNIIRSLEYGEDPSKIDISLMACYSPLHLYSWVDSLKEGMVEENLYKCQVSEPRQEKSLQTALKRLSKIHNHVSIKVSDQYEAYPYPRWVNLGLFEKPRTILELSKELNLKIDDGLIKTIQRPNILVAGCGTGQHSLTTASRFANSHVTAIDLSVSSLSYALRKSNEFGVKNITYMQEDILNLAKIERKFDIIECSGVLHHMEDPLLGWKTLVDCLKPGGLMSIGLYSEIAREYLKRTRDEMSLNGVNSSTATMKCIRAKLRKSKEPHHIELKKTRDFYSVSAMKDLLFHVQETCFTLPQIKQHISELGLIFCGFERNARFQMFKDIYDQESDQYDLDKWHTFETYQPRTFRGMYQFWCQKPISIT